MNLQLENINAIVENDKLQPILSTRMYSGLQDQGLFSENIFGKLGSKERSKTFAYVNLSTKIIHPEAFNLIFMSVDPIFGKFLLNKQKYSLDKLGNLIEDENGVSGVFHFVKLFPKINLDTFKKKSPKEINFIRENSKKIFIDKYLVLPAGVRDIVISKSTGKQQIQYSDLNELYGSLISMSSTMKQMKSSPDLAEPMAQNIQRYTIKINDWIKSRLKGKTGLIRGGLLRKTTDFSGRLLITTDNTLKMGEIGLPYQVVLRLYEPLALYHIQRSNDHLAILQHFFKQDTQIDTYQLKMLFKKLNTTPDILPALIKDYFIEVAKEIVKDKVIIYKRDPVENRHSMMSAYIRVEDSGFAMKIHPIDLSRQGGDHDGDAMAIYTLFTKEANEEAKKKMHPDHSKSTWASAVSNNDLVYGQNLYEASSAIYNATLK